MLESLLVYCLDKNRIHPFYHIRVFTYKRIRSYKINIIPTHRCSTVFGKLKLGRRVWLEFVSTYWIWSHPYDGSKLRGRNVIGRDESSPFLHDRVVIRLVPSSTMRKKHRPFGESRPGISRIRGFVGRRWSPRVSDSFVYAKLALRHWLFSTRLLPLLLFRRFLCRNFAARRGQGCSVLCDKTARSYWTAKRCSSSFLLRIMLFRKLLRQIVRMCLDGSGFSCALFHFLFFFLLLNIWSLCEGLSDDYVVRSLPFSLRIIVLFRKLIRPCADGSVFSNFIVAFCFIFFSFYWIFEISVWMATLFVLVLFRKLIKPCV